MIEVNVGSIEQHPVTGAPLVALEPRDAETRSRLVLPLSTAVACSLNHELQGQTTLRGTVYALVGRIADILGGQIICVEIVPAPHAMAAGRLRIEGTEGTTLLPIEIALGIGLVVVLGLPLWVAEELVHQAPRLDRPAVSEVPDAFRRAFS